MNEEFYKALALLQQEKGIPQKYMLEKIRAAIASAVKRDRSVPAENVDVVFDETKKTISVFIKRLVVDVVEDPSIEISVEEARNISAKYQLGDFVRDEVDPATVGRIAAKVGKNVIVQGINEAVNGSLINEFEGQKGSIVTGTVDRVDEFNRVVYLNINGYSLPLNLRDQIPGETFRDGDHVKVCVSDIRRNAKSQEIVLSRTNAEFLRRLFQVEIPEVADGTVRVMAISREAGSRSKVAVWSKNPDVDPVGACIGPKQMRINSILSELNGERIDLIKYNPDPEEFIVAALSPASVRIIEINKNDRTCRVAVAADQLSLAIGKTGQNVRLAAGLTNYHIDIVAE